MIWDNVWTLLSGLGFFLYGITLIEKGIKELAGRTFKLFLQKYTENKISAIVVGTIVTAILQSSSVVTFMVLAFVGAGIINMRNALAVVLGANLGTTIDSWLVAIVGFKVDFEKFVLPIIVFSVAGIIVFNERHKVYYFAFFLLGLALLFFGLANMKSGMEIAVNNFDFSQYSSYNRLVFVLIGFLITAIIQSSSATIAITLSALNSGIITFGMAIPVVLGSELGTTLKSVFGFLGNSVEKKRVAFGNIIFNLVMTIMALFTMSLMIDFIIEIIKIKDPLIGLVCYQSLINFMGILLFYPFLNLFSNFLEKRFLLNNFQSTLFIQKVSPEVTEAALTALEEETNLFIRRVIYLNNSPYAK
jgi:phosphate:Na+ symporter